MQAIQLDMAGKTKEAILKITFAIDTNPEATQCYILRLICLSNQDVFLELS